MPFEIIREDGAWPDDDVLSALAQRAMSAIADHLRTDQEVTYVFSSDNAIRALNRHWRDKDKPTNVLSFPDGDVSPDGIVHLGDVLLAVETITREALDEGKTFDNHLIHLMIHGTLHLLGHDHMTDTEAAAMESIEIAALAKIGIGNPYQDA